jgi:hypothetical protein
MSIEVRLFPEATDQFILARAPRERRRFGCE